MLLQLEDASQNNIDMLLKFDRQHHLKLLVIDDAANNYMLPGKKLLPAQLNELIEKSRVSGIIAMDVAHQLIRSTYSKD